MKIVFMMNSTLVNSKELSWYWVCMLFVLQEVSRYICGCLRVPGRMQPQSSSGSEVKDSLRYNECRRHTASGTGTGRERSMRLRACVYALLCGVVSVLQTVRVMQQDDSYNYWMRQRSVISVHPSFLESLGAGRARLDRGRRWSVLREWSSPADATMGVHPFSEKCPILAFAITQTVIWMLKKWKALTYYHL